MYTDRILFGRLWMAAAAGVVLLAASAQTAIAQPDSPAAMRERIATLESELQSLRQKVASLTDERDRLRFEVEQLRKAMVENGPGRVAPRQGTPDRPAPRQREADPNATPSRSVPIAALSRDPLDSPDALFIALLLDYRETLASDPTVTALPEPAEVAEWIEVSSDTFDGTTSWLVRIDGVVAHTKNPGVTAEDRQAPRRMLATVLDTTTLMPISRPAMIDIPRRLDGRFPDRIGTDEMLFAEMRVKVAAACLFQPGRETAGPFDYPPFLGPYAGFGYTVDLVGLKFAEFAELKARATSKNPPADR